MSTRSLSRAEKVAMGLGIGGNALLFAGKIAIGLSFQSISIVSDSLNSLTDIVASLIVLVSVRSSLRDADEQHPYGHKRAQPLAGLVVAIFTGIVGFQIITQSATRLFTGDRMQPGFLPILLVSAVMVVKLGMHLFVRAVALRTRSTALMASALDHRNDVLVSSAVLVGVVFANLGLPVMDPIVAILIGVWIIKAGISIGQSNLKYLMGEAPPAELVDTIRARALAVPGVQGLNDVLAHYVGTSLQIEVHIELDGALDLETAHAIGKQVQKVVEAVEDVSRAFVHIDPLEVR
jgi:cation diffusion facilitator family transporter